MDRSTKEKQRIVLSATDIKQAFRNAFWMSGFNLKYKGHSLSAMNDI